MVMKTMRDFMSNVSEESRKKMRASALRRIKERPWTAPGGWNKGIKTGISPPNYKGENVSYSGLHHWVKYHKGKPQSCEECGSTDWLEWANKSGSYKRVLDDWISLCVKCHRKRDDVGRKAWVTRRARKK